jgi:hypothetical protein
MSTESEKQNTVPITNQSGKQFQIPIYHRSERRKKNFVFFCDYAKRRPGKIKFYLKTTNLLTNYVEGRDKILNFAANQHVSL